MKFKLRQMVSKVEDNKKLRRIIKLRRIHHERAISVYFCYNIENIKAKNGGTNSCSSIMAIYLKKTSWNAKKIQHQISCLSLSRFEDSQNLLPICFCSTSTLNFSKKTLLNFCWSRGQLMSSMWILVKMRCFRYCGSDVILKVSKSVRKYQKILR